MILDDFNLTQQQEQQYRAYAHFLIEQNKVMNLTAITDLDEIYEKHFKDSLLISSLLENVHTFCDVGSGAGFPGLVLAIKHPEIEFTLVEPTMKRCNFLNQTKDLLELKNVVVINARAEDYAQDKREYFDVVSARAVANLVMLSELCLPLVKVGGQFIAMKGQKGLQELEEASYAIELLGGEVDHSMKSLLSDDSLRYNIVISKVKKTPMKYPRMFSSIKKSPLFKKKGG